MKHYRYVIVGGGMTADAALAGIREHDREGSIGLFSAERFPPYSRPPLSKALWKGEPMDGIFLRPAVADLGVEEHLGVQVAAIDRANRTLSTAYGTSYSYDRLLLATGGAPKRLPFGEDVVYFRYLEDYLRLRALVREGKRRFAVIGGGFIGAEMAAALRMNDCEVTMVFPEAAVLGRVLPADLAFNVTGYYRNEHGVNLLTGDVPVAIERAAGGGEGEYVVRTRGGASLAVDAVVAGLGIEPAAQLAAGCGLAVEDGIVVNSRLETSDPAIFAAGDVARFPARGLDKLVRVEHEDNALAQGRLAGANMAGAGEEYTHLPFFYSDLFDLGFEAVGDLNSGLQTVADWREPFREGVVYYLEGGRIRGVLLWNVWESVPRAEELIKEGRVFSRPEEVRGLI